MEHLGKKATEKFSGFTGTITGFCAYLTASNRIQITPNGLDKDGKPQQAQWFDIAAIEISA